MIKLLYLRVNIRCLDNTYYIGNIIYTNNDSIANCILKCLPSLKLYAFCLYILQK